MKIIRRQYYKTEKIILIKIESKAIWKSILRIAHIRVTVILDFRQFLYKSIL